MTTFRISFTIDSDSNQAQNLFNYLVSELPYWPRVEAFEAELMIEVGEHEWAILTQAKYPEES